MRARPVRPSPHQSCQGGAGLVGFLLAALPIFALGAGGIETAHSLFLRQALSHVLFDAGRAAATQQAQPAVLAQAFEGALRALHPDPRQLHAALAQRRRSFEGLPWRIRILSPARAAFGDHSNTDIRAPAGSPAQGLALIRNDRQQAQHARALARGWPGGRGPASGTTIFEANTLELELIWPHRPLLPGVAAILRLMAGVTPPGDDRHPILAQGWLPIVRRVTLSMHSHPARWPDLPDGRVIHGAAQPLPDGAARPGCPDTGGCTPQWTGSVTGAPAASGNESGLHDRLAPPIDARPDPGTGGADATTPDTPSGIGSSGTANDTVQPVVDEAMSCDPPLP